MSTIIDIEKVVAAVKRFEAQRENAGERAAYHRREKHVYGAVEQDTIISTLTDVIEHLKWMVTAACREQGAKSPWDFMTDRG